MALSVTVDPFCSHFGFAVGNPGATVRTVTLSDAGGVLATQVIAPRHAGFLALSTSTAPASTVTLEENGAPFFSYTVRLCTTVDDRSVTIAAGGTYTLTNLLVNATMAPRPAHGSVVQVGATALRYTPDPCFAGVDRFGYTDPVGATQGTVTVTVRPGTCRLQVTRLAADCAARGVTFVLDNPYAAPARVTVATGGTVAEFTAAAGARTERTVIVDRSAPVTRAVTFSLPSAGVAVFDAQVQFGCPELATVAPGLADTGTPVTGPLLLGAGAVLAGAGLLVAGRQCPRRSSGPPSVS